MQRVAEAMKTSFVSNKQDASVLSRNKRSGRWGMNVTERRSQGLDTSFRQLDRPIFADMKLHSSIYLKAAVKLADTAHVLNGSKRFIGRSKPRQTTSIPLPPMNGSRTITGKVEHTDAAPSHRHQSIKPEVYTHNVLTENTVFHVLVAKGRKVNWKSNTFNKASVAFTTAKKAAIQDLESSRGLIKQGFHGHPPATSPSAPVDQMMGSKNDASGPGAKYSRTKHDASLCKAGPQREFCFNDSTETETESCPDKGCLERLNEGSNNEYYNDQRITEWVLKVNSSFFSGNNELTGSKHVEEQDVATIKIMYSGN